MNDDAAERAEAIRTLRIMRDQNLISYGRNQGHYHHGEARDLHQAIEIISRDGGMTCESFHDAKLANRIPRA